MIFLLKIKIPLPWKNCCKAIIGYIKPTKAKNSICIVYNFHFNKYHRFSNFGCNVNQT